MKPKTTRCLKVFFSLCAALAVGVAAVMLTRQTQPTEVPVPEARSKIVWVECHSLLYSSRDAACGRFYPAGDHGRFFLPFAVFRSPTSTADTAPLVYVAGGPGGGMQTHVDSLQLWAYWLDETQLERDLVIYDQRGLKPGEPYWDCEAYNQLNRELLPQNVNIQQEYAMTAGVLTDCLEQFDQWLRGTTAAVPQGIQGLTSVTAADNLNRMLDLLGYDARHLWGVSYGTRLALVAAQQQPERTRSLLLDSPYPLNKGGVSEKPALYAAALNRFWALCRNNAAFCGRDVADPEALFWRVIDKVHTEPVTYRVTLPGSPLPTRFVLNGHRLFSLALYALYDQRFYGELLAALTILDGSESAPDDTLDPVQLLLNSFVASAFDPDFNTMVFYAIECNDNAVEPTQVYDDALADHPKLRGFLYLDGEQNPCRLPFFNQNDLLQPQVLPHTPALVLAGELDPVTPVAWGESLVKSLPAADMVVAPRIGHAVLASGFCQPAFYNDWLEEPEKGREIVERHCE